GDQAGPPVDDGAAVIEGVVVQGPGDDDAVEVGDGDADVLGRPLPERPGSWRAVDVEGVAQASVAGGENARRTVDDDAEVADQAGVQDVVEVGAVAAGAVGAPAEPGPARRGERRGECGHAVYARNRVVWRVGPLAA